ncbi:MAG: hypothetical protein KatS3mg109_1005 [Pirellulaceae bacterium]|nr:MAG: hypothetical protein KatS3mg109_1005 [Pirellulaceae bacterium]GIW95069.1 MAG: hypothetical protein KatS3mg110_3110 [Pirellulaceae bacterium]
MSHNSFSGTIAAPNADLQTILAAWSDATRRLQQTHEALRNEVRRLATELEIKNRELARKNRLADLGQMASHVAHEVRNGLVPITLYLSLLKRHLAGDPICSELVQKLENAFRSLESTVNDLLQFTQSREPNWEPISVRKLVEQIVQSLAPQWDAQSVRIEVDVPAGDSLIADRQQLERALLNLLLNALDAMPRGGTLTVTSWHDDQWYELEVADSGEGFAPEHRLKIFEPFFTTKQDGTGLGLAIVSRIAELHGGSVQAYRCPEGGAAFVLRLPYRAAMKAAA